jgi:hypothetical protein
MGGAIPLLPPTPLWLTQGKMLSSLTFTFPLLAASLECDVYGVPEIAKEAIHSLEVFSFYFSEKTNQIFHKNSVCILYVSLYV